MTQDNTTNNHSEFNEKITNLDTDENEQSQEIQSAVASIPHPHG